MVETSLAPAKTSVFSVWRLAGRDRDRDRRDSPTGSGCGRCRNRRSAAGRPPCRGGTSATAQYLSVMPSQPSVDLPGVTCFSFSILEYLISCRPSLPVTPIRPSCTYIEVRAVGLVEAGDAAVVRQRYRRAAGVVDRVGDGEHVIVVDRDRALESQALVVGVGQRHRASTASARLPSTSFQTVSGPGRSPLPPAAE